MQRTAQQIFLAGVIVWGATLPGCSLFSHYPSETEEAQASFRAGQFQQSYALFRQGAERGEGDALAWTLDAALAAHTGGLFRESKESFENAERVIIGYRDEPSVSGRTVVDNAAALLSNDKALPYDGEGFERVLVQTYQSLNYLFSGELQNAQVKARKALEIQREEEEFMEKEWEVEAGTNETLNLFSRYLIGLAYEGMGSRGDVSNAVIAYQQIADRFPECWLARQDVIRLKRALGDDAEADNLQRQWNVQERPRAEQGEGELVLIFQCGVIPEKDYKKVFETRQGTRFSIPLPEFRDRPNPVAGATLIASGSEAPASMVEPLDRTARQSLDDRYPSIIARAAIRAGIKIGATAALAKAAHDRQKQGKDGTALALGALAVGIFGAISEQPDLRSWITLPNSFQVARMYLPAGVHDIRVRLQSSSGATVRMVDIPQVDVQESRQVFINLRTWDTNAFYQIGQGGAAL